MARTLEKGGQVGGKTGGANGTLDGDIFETNSGQFSVGDYITSVFTPYGNIRDANHVSYEGIGLTPDEGYEIEFDKTVFYGGTDERLKTAFQWIKDHRYQTRINMLRKKNLPEFYYLSRNRFSHHRP